MTKNPLRDNFCSRPAVDNSAQLRMLGGVKTERSRGIRARPGDDGRTLARGRREWKNSARMELLGDLDELNCLLGAARRRVRRAATRAALRTAQETLFAVGSEVAGAARGVGERELAALDARCAALRGSARAPRGFVVPGRMPGGAALDLARAVARRCERRAVAWRRAGGAARSGVVPWLNRLGEWLWLLARAEES